MIEKFRFSVFIGASTSRHTHRVIKRDEMYVIQTRLANYKGWADAYKYARFTSIADLFRSREFKNLFINPKNMEGKQ